MILFTIAPETNRCMKSLSLFPPDHIPLFASWTHTKEWGKFEYVVGNNKHPKTTRAATRKVALVAMKTTCSGCRSRALFLRGGIDMTNISGLVGAFHLD
jgi:asparagine synthetase B (glutamine-hydrolysing)